MVSGLLNAASDIGSMMIIVTLSFIPLRKNQGDFNRCSSWIWFVHHWFRLVKTLLVVFLIPYVERNFDGISVVIRGTIVQLKTQDHIRGRVMSANSIFIMSSNEMGQFESGVKVKL